MALHRTTHYRTFAVASGVFIAMVGWADSLHADPIRVSINTLGKTSNALLSGQSSVAADGRYSLHAGALVPGGNPELRVLHAPGVSLDPNNPFPDEAKNTFPTQWTYVGPRVGYTVEPTPLPTYADPNDPNRQRRYVYPTARKPFNMPAQTTTLAQARRDTPEGNIFAQAEARCAFTRAVVNGKWMHTADPTGTALSIVPTGYVGQDNDIYKKSKSGVLIYDPLDYQSDVPFVEISGSAALSRADFLVELGDDSAWAGSSTKAGTSFPFWSSADYDPLDPIDNPLGLSDQGLPLIYSLSLRFEGSDPMNPDIDFAFNPEFEYFDPRYPDIVWDEADVETLVRDRLRGELRFLDGRVTLAPNTEDEFSLFGYRADAFTPTSSYQVDYAGATILTLPEPATLMLLAFGGLVLTTRRR